MNGSMVASNVSPVVQVGRIGDFLRRRLDGGGTKKCVSVGLAHLAESGHAIILQRPVAQDLSGSDLEAHVADIAQEMAQEAQEHAATFPRPQRYGIVAYTKGDTVLGQHAFLVSPPPDNMAIGGETEPPTEKGLVSAAMRYSEASMRMLMLGMHQTQERLIEENRTLRDRCNQLEERHFQVIKQSEELMSQRHLREMVEKREVADAERLERIWKRLEHMLPALAEKFELGGPGASPMIKFVKSLKPEQLSKIVGELSPEQMAQFQELLETLKGVAS